MDSFPSSTLGTFGQTDKDVNVQPVHSSGGLTRVVHAPSLPGKLADRLFTAGDDYLVRILPALIDGDFDPLTIDDATKSITWIDADADYLVSAAEDGCVRIYQHSMPVSDDINAPTSPTDLVCILSRSSLAARCAALERNVARDKTPRVAVCTDELSVRIIDSSDPKRVQLLTGHERSVRAASWSPKEAVLATSSCDGTVKFWNLATTEPTCTATLANVLTASHGDSELTAEIAWHPSGNHFVLPTKTHELAIYSYGPACREIGMLVAMDDNDVVRAPRGDISAMSFCSNGRYLAVSTTDGQVTVWDWTSRKAIRSKKSTSLVTSISWHPSLDSLAWSDNSGQVARWREVIGAALPSPFEKVYFSHSHKEGAQSRPSQSDALFDDQFSDDGDNDLDVEARKVDDLFSDPEDNEKRPRYGSHRRTRKALGAQATNAQAAFQPNATPMRNSRRYLAFNTIGSLLAIDQGTHQSISFESFDAGARRNWRFVDEKRINMASIGVHGALMAAYSESKEADQDHIVEFDDEGKEKGKVSSITFKPFEVPGGYTVPGAEWSVELPHGEVAVALAMAGRRSARNVSLDNCSAIVATTAGYLRFFSGGGVQRYVWAFGSQIVTMAAGNRLLLVVHRNSATSNNHQNLLYTLIDITTMDVRQEGILPIVEGASLSWAGFSEVDVPGVFDNRGVLLLLDRALSAKGQARWIPGLDTRTLAAKESKSGAAESISSKIRFWPVGMDGTNLLAIMLKGSDSPDASSPHRPLIQDLPFSVPVLDLSSPTGILEEQVLRQNQLASFARTFRSSLTQNEEDDEFYADLLEQPSSKSSTLEHEADKALLQIIQHACKKNDHQRVLDAARELHTSRTLDAAQQIGTFFHLSSLVDRMGALREWVIERRERDERASSANEAFAGVAQPVASSRVLVAGSPSPTQGDSFRRNGTNAKAALGRGFDAHAPSRKYGGASSDLAKFGQTPGGSWSGTSKSTGQRSTNVDRSQNRDLDEEEDEDEQMPHSNGSPTAPSNKRRANETDEGEDSGRAKKNRELVMSSPFSNKTNRDLAPSKADSAGSTVAKNPFARTAAGLTRDPSLHKSTSFFDRVDNDSALASVNAGRRQGGSKTKTKQTTLFGLTSNGRLGSGSKAAASSDANERAVAATPVFGSDTQMTDEPRRKSPSHVDGRPTTAGGKPGPPRGDSVQRRTRRR